MTELIGEVFNAVEGVDLAEMPEIIEVASQAKGRYSAGAAALVVEYWAERDLVGVREWLTKQPAKTRAQFTGPMMRIWGKTNPVEMLAWINALPQEEKDTTLRSSLYNLASGDLAKIGPELLPFALADYSKQSNASLDSLMLKWAAQDPTHAAEALGRLPAGAAKKRAVELLAQNWAKHDPEKAKAWVDTLGDPVLATELMPFIAFGLASTDPQAAAELLGEQPATAKNQQTFRQIAASWIVSAPEAAIAWVEKIQDATLRGQILDSGVHHLAFNNVDTAAALFKRLAGTEKGLGFASSASTLGRQIFLKGGIDKLSGFASTLPEKVAEEVYGAGIARWAQTDAEAAANWAVQQPDGPVKKNALYQSAGQMLANPGKAVTWAEALPKSESSDSALARVATSVLRKDPATAERLAGRMTRTEKIEPWAIYRAMNWMNDDEPSARKWLQSTSLISAPTKEKLLSVSRTSN